MTKEEYIKCYKFCLEQGWVHNTPEDYVMFEYFDPISGRQTKYKSHLDKIIKNEYLKDVHILIGEAPPYYPNKIFPKRENRKYFYDEKQSMNTGYFKEPCNHFLEIDDWKNDKRTKSDLLNGLANKGVLIFDIFPFPVFQSTDIREKIVRGESEEDENAVSSFYSSRLSQFNVYLDTFFQNRFQCLIESFGDKKIHIYMFAPKLASVQFLYWLKDIIWKDNLVKFSSTFISQDFVTTEKSEKSEKPQLFMTKSLKSFVLSLANESNKEAQTFISEILLMHPIFMNGSGNPDFKNFVNGKRN